MQCPLVHPISMSEYIKFQTDTILKYLSIQKSNNFCVHYDLGKETSLVIIKESYFCNNVFIITTSSFQARKISPNTLNIESDCAYAYSYFLKEQTEYPSSHIYITSLRQLVVLDFNSILKKFKRERAIHILQQLFLPYIIHYLERPYGMRSEKTWKTIEQIIQTCQETKNLL